MTILWPFAFPELGLGFVGRGCLLGGDNGNASRVGIRSLNRRNWDLCINASLLPRTRHHRLSKPLPDHTEIPAPLFTQFESHRTVLEVI